MIETRARQHQNFLAVCSSLADQSERIEKRQGEGIARPIRGLTSPLVFLLLGIHYRSILIPPVRHMRGSGRKKDKGSTGETSQAYLSGRRPQPPLILSTGVSHLNRLPGY